MDIREQFLADIREDLLHDRLVLPRLPDLAIKIRSVVEDERSSAATVARITSVDAALSARLVYVANSPLHRRHTQVEDVQTAVARLGNNVVGNLVMGFAVHQLFQLDVSPTTRRRLQQLQQRNIQVAAYCHVLARKFTSLKPDVAMLGGLVHRIGALPLLIRAGSIPRLAADDEMVESVIDQMHKLVGKTILQSWGFPAHLVAVASEHEDIWRNPGPHPDYVDLVLVALLHQQVGKSLRLGGIDLATVPAVAKLGLSATQCIQTMKEAHDEVMEVQRMLSG